MPWSICAPSFYTVFQLQSHSKDIWSIFGEWPFKAPSAFESGSCNGVFAKGFRGLVEEVTNCFPLSGISCTMTNFFRRRFLILMIFEIYFCGLCTPLRHLYHILWFLISRAFQHDLICQINRWICSLVIWVFCILTIFKSIWWRYLINLTSNICFKIYHRSTQFFNYS